MATLGRALAKNRTQVVQQALIDGGGLALGGDFPGHVIYYAKTTDNSATEAFINGKGAAAMQGTTYYNRLYIPESTVVLADYNAVIFNATDDTFSFDKGHVVIANINGTTAGLDVLNGDADAGDDIFVRYAIPESGAAANDGLTVSEFLGGATLDWTADNTDDFLKLTVTGITAKTIYWKIYLCTYTLNETEAISNFYFGDTAAQDDGD